MEMKLFLLNNDVLLSDVRTSYIVFRKKLCVIVWFLVFTMSDVRPTHNEM